MRGGEAGECEVEFGVGGEDEAVGEGVEDEVGVADAGPEVWMSGRYVSDTCHMPIFEGQRRRLTVLSPGHGAIE